MPLQQTSTPVKRKKIKAFIQKVQRGRVVQEVEYIYIETGWLTPTIILVFIEVLVREGAKMAKKIPRKKIKDSK